MKFTIQMDPDPRMFTLAFNQWAQEVKDWRPAWMDMRKMFQNHERQHFDSEGETTGARFAPLLGRKSRWSGYMPYAAWKSKNYPGLPIMQRDRVLYNALTSGGRGSLFRRGRQNMEIGLKRGTKVYTYGRAHQRGEGPAYAGINKEARPPIRADLNVESKSTFGYAASQIMQAHIVLARRRAFSREMEDSMQKRRMENPAAAKATIKKMIDGTWR